MIDDLVSHARAMIDGCSKLFVRPNDALRLFGRQNGLDFVEPTVSGHFDRTFSATETIDVCRILSIKVNVQCYR